MWGELLGRGVSCLLACSRFFVGVYVAGYPGLPLIVRAFGLSEAIVSAAGVFNACRAEIDRSAVGWLVVVMYSAGYYFQPSPGALTPAVELSLAVCLVLRMWAFWDLGLCYSVGPPSFIRVARMGLYKIVRHPMAGTGILLRFVACVANPLPVNWGCFCVMLVSAVCQVFIEENFLRRFVAWRRYAVGVKWRLIPGLW